MRKENPEIILFAKERPGLDDVIALLHSYTNNLQIFTGDRHEMFPSECLDIHPDMVISYICSWIIPKALLENTSKWAINFHPGPPEYPGTGCSNFALYHGEQRYGVTAHLMDATVDTGRIIGVKRFDIQKDDTVYSLTQRAYEHLSELFKDVIVDLFENDSLPSSNEIWKRKPYTRRQLDDLCQITPEMDQKEIDRRVKATTYPGMPGAFMNLGNHKFLYQEVVNG